MVDKFLTNGGLQHNFVLGDFFEGLEHFFLALGEEIEMLHRTLIEHDISPHLLVVAPFLFQQGFEVAILAYEIAFGQSGLVVIGRIRLDTGRHLSENRGAGRGGRNGGDGGVAVFRAIVVRAFVENRSASVGFGQFK